MEHLLQHDDRSVDIGNYDFAEPHKDTKNYPEASLIRAISETRAFKRLSDIRFLGALDYCLVTHPNGSQSNARFTRSQHSEGVAVLAQAYLRLKNHSLEQRLLCVAAAMLHDIGHPPFSHTLEPVFIEHFGINHHSASENIILGKVYSNELPSVLANFGLRPESVIDILNGNDESFDGFFSGPINFDTIEGILRSRNYLKMQPLGHTPLRVLQAATNRDNSRSKEIVDAFWACKDEMYTLVIRSKLGVLFDSLFQEAARDNISAFSEPDFFLTESQAFKKFPELRDATQKRYWHKMVDALLPDVVPFQIRRFYVDEEGDFFLREDRRRYRQSKTASTLTLKDVVPA